MTTLTITIPDSLSEKLETRSRSIGHRSLADYVVAVLSEDAERVKSEDELRQLLEEGLQGPFHVVDQSFWYNLRAEIDSEIAQARPGL